ncbi:MAG: hypothetical protein M1831_006112 [Alyxoria varia]|nr:MAG: hypothetical protein M1831_006112 [Alyxoria varia]
MEVASPQGRPSFSSDGFRLSVSSSTQPSSSKSSASPFDDYSPSVCGSVTSPSESKTDLENDEDLDRGPGDSSPAQGESTNESAGPPKRGRGRPRKHPIIPRREDKNSLKARTKTGCLTCRRRKKKCDESKPNCLNCQKTNAICEGYRLPEPWQSHKNKKPKDLPVLIKGVETEIDRTLLDHFNQNLSQTLCLCNGQKSPFTELIVPMALEDCGLMHSLLCLSGFHFLASQTLPEGSMGEELIARRHFHFDKAISMLRIKISKAQKQHQQSLVDDPTIAQTIILCLKTIMAGEHKGEYRMHLDAARHLIISQRSPNEDFQNFLMEFFVYHDVSNAITSLQRQSVLMNSEFRLPSFIPPEAGSFLGVLDSLFISISKVTNLRDTIRQRRSHGLQPLVDYQTLHDAQTIDTELRHWTCPQQPGTPRYTASLLYRQCTWIYLHRTISPSVPDQNLCKAVDEGLEYLAQLRPPSDGAPAILLMPVFLLGCAAFEKHQRPKIISALDNLQDYRHTGNIQHARTVVEKIWKMMDNKDEESWDWEGLMHRLKLDFMVS